MPKHGIDKGGMMKAKLLKGHAKNCAYITRPKQNPQFWFLNTYERVKHIGRDASGGHRSENYRWVPFRCPDTRCEANGIVRADFLEAAIKLALKEKQ